MGFRKGLGIIIAGFALAGCAEYVAAELAVHAISAGVNYAKSESSPSNSNVIRSLSETDLCRSATVAGKWEIRSQYSNHVKEAKRRGLSCGIGKKVKVASSSNASTSQVIRSLSETDLCSSATVSGKWETKAFYLNHVQEAKRRGLSCGVGQASSTQSTLIPSNNGSTLSKVPVRKSASEKAYEIGTLCDYASVGYPVKRWRDEKSGFWDYVKTAKRKGLTCGVDEIDSSIQIATGLNAKSTARSLAAASNKYRHYDNSSICSFSTTGNPIYWDQSQPSFVREAKRRGLNCGVGQTASTQIASIANSNQPKAPTSAALLAAQRKARELEQQLAALRAEKAKQQQTISSDTKLPTITIASASTKGKQGIIRGKARDNTGIAEVMVGGRPVPFDASGNFRFETFVPVGGKQVTIQVTDLNGLSNSKTVKLDRSASNTTIAITFESLNPLGRKVVKNEDALALIIGVDGYSKTPARAIYADSDAKVFADYANEKLGIPANRIKTLVNDGADESGMLLAVKDWLSRASKKDKSDVYVFFAGHGLASQDGEKMYLLPYDGSPRLLEKTAILRDELFSDIAAANPRSVTVFLDTCYSGETRGNEMLIAGRPIGIRALEQSIPDNFTLMTAAAGDQIANPLKEAKHGMFSYFLMKGMEGVADANQDNKITALELHEYVKENVWQQSSNKQLPELQGDGNRVLVQFQ